MYRSLLVGLIWVGCGGLSVEAEVRSPGKSDLSVAPTGGDADADADSDADSDGDADLDTVDTASTGGTIDTQPPIDTGPPGTTTDPSYQGPTLIDTIASGCGASTTTWLHRIETTGLTSDGLVYAIETANSPPWDEQHTVPSVAYDPLGWWDDLERVLTDDASLATWAPDVSSLFSCGVHDNANTMTWMFRVYDVDGALADCVLFGHDPVGLQAGDYDAVMINGMTDPQDRIGCPIW